MGETDRIQRTAGPAGLLSLGGGGVTWAADRLGLVWPTELIYAVLGVSTLLMIWSTVLFAIRAYRQVGDPTSTVGKLVRKLEPTRMILGGVILVLMGLTLIVVGTLAQKRLGADAAPKPPPTATADVPPPKPSLTPYQVDSKLQTIDEALKLLNGDMKPAVLAVRSEVGWRDYPVGANDTSPAARERWLTPYMGRLYKHPERLQTILGKAQTFQNQNQQWPDIVAAMSLPQLNYDNEYRDYHQALGTIIRISRQEPMDTLQQLASGYVAAIVAKLAAIEAGLDGAAQKLIALRNETQLQR